MKPNARILKARAQWRRPPTGRVEIKIPTPPSVNTLYRNRTTEEIARAKALGRPVRGRKRTDRYETWLSGAGAVLNAQRPGRIDGPYTLCLLIPRSKTADVGNFEKATSDLLQKNDVIENDQKAEWLVIGWLDTGLDVVVIVNAGTSLALPMAEAERWAA